MAGPRAAGDGGGGAGETTSGRRGRPRRREITGAAWVCEDETRAAASSGRAGRLRVGVASVQGGIEEGGGVPVMAAATA